MKSQIKFAHASLFQLPCVLVVKVFSYTGSFLVVVGFVLFVLFFLNKTPASISAQDGRHTIDEGLYNEQAVCALFAAKLERCKQ